MYKYKHVYVYRVCVIRLDANVNQATFEIKS